MTPLELALLILGAVMVGAVFGWIGVCLVRCRREDNSEAFSRIDKGGVRGARSKRHNVERMR